MHEFAFKVLQKTRMISIYGKGNRWRFGAEEMNNLVFRNATKLDLPLLVEMLREDELGKHRESTNPSLYEGAFLEIETDHNNQVLVAEFEGNLVAMLQLTFIRHLTFQGGLRAQIEGVRVHKNYRGQGIGKNLIAYAISMAKAKKCHLVQLTSNKNRKEALQFYEKIGFKGTHVGFKLEL
jgi:ribosomal protein S18 acetylase RimI-like enzyme